MTSQLERLAVSDGFDALAFLESLMHNVPGAVYRCALDDDWTMHLIGDEIERISGYPATDFIEHRVRTYSSIVHPEDRERVEAEARTVAESDATFEMEYRILHADGSERWVLERGQRTIDSNGDGWLDGLIFDITTRRRLEKLARQSEAEAARLAEVEESRSRIIEAADAARRRIERDLHDGAQQRFVALSLMLRVAQRTAAAGGDVSEALARAAEELDAGLNDLRELARGIHPAVLTDHGLTGAVKALAARCAVPVKVHCEVDERLVPAVELAAYFTIAEALTNAAKYSEGSAGEVSVVQLGTELIVEVRDNGRGGAEANGAGGLNGLRDRLQALGGDLHVESPPGEGTTLRATLPWRPAA